MKGLILGCVMICMTMGCAARQGASNSVAYVGTVLESMIGVHSSYEDNKKFWDEKFEKEKPTPESKRIIMGVND